MQSHRILAAVACALAGTAWIASAGSLNPAGAPSPTMHTLDEVYSAVTSAQGDSNYPAFSAEDMLYAQPGTGVRIFIELDGVSGAVTVSGYEDTLEALASQQAFAYREMSDLRLLVEFDGAMAELINRLQSQGNQTGFVHWVVATSGGLVPIARIELQQSTISAVRPRPEAGAFDMCITITRGDYTTWTRAPDGSNLGSTSASIP